MDERTYSKTAIRERRLALQRQLALQQRQLEALAKMDDAADELERVEREIEALSRGETQPEPQPEQPGELETVSSGPHPAAPDGPVQAIPSEPESAEGGTAEGGTAEPQNTGARALEVLKDREHNWLEVRDVLAGMQERGWIDTDTERALSRLRHSLRRLAHNNPRVERDETDTTYRYRYVSLTDSYALTSVPHANGTAYPPLQGG